MNLYDILGVARDATADAIKRAYRKKAMENHPDRGGDAAEFAKVQQAHDVLMDEARRLQYDRSGSTAQHDTRSAAMSNLAVMFLNLVQGSPNLDTSNLIHELTHSIMTADVQLDEQIRQVDRQIDKFEKAEKRLQFKGQGDNFMAQALRAAIGQHQQQIVSLQRSKESAKEMLAILEQYDYQTDARSPAADEFFSMFTSASSSRPWPG